MTLDVTVNVNNNPTVTEFCIQETNTGKYVQVDGTLRGRRGLAECSDLWDEDGDRIDDRNNVYLPGKG